MGLWNKKPEGDGTQSKSEADLLIEKLGPVIGAAIDEKIKPLSDGFQKLQGEWDGLKAEAGKTDPPDPNKNPDGSDVTDAQKAERERLATFALTVTTNARITENDCLSSVQAQWPQVIAEARQIFQQTPWQKKAEAGYPQYCSNVIDMLVGREAKKGGLRYDSKGGKFLIEDSVAKTGGADSPLADPDLTWTDPHTGRTLTAEQQLVKLGIDPTKFAESMKNGAV